MFFQHHYYVLYDITKVLKKENVEISRVNEI